MAFGSRPMLCVYGLWARKFGCVYGCLALESIIRVCVTVRVCIFFRVYECACVFLGVYMGSWFVCTLWNRSPKETSTLPTWRTLARVNTSLDPVFFVCMGPCFLGLQ